MAQYFTDFRENAIASGTPAGWTARWTTTGVTRAIQSQATGHNGSGKQLRVTHSTTAQRFTSWDVIDADPNRETIAVTMLARVAVDGAGVNVFGGPGARGSGATGGENSLSAVFGSDSNGFEEFRLAKALNGTRTYTVANAGSPDDWEPTNYYWLTLTASGTTATLSVATVENPTVEIATAQITDAETGVGWAGVWTYGSLTDLQILAVGVGTGGDSAPRTPVAPTTSPTIGTITPSGTSASVPYTGLDLYATGVEYRIDGGAWVDAGVTNPISLSGLTESTEYDIELRAYNAAGPGPISTLATFTTTAGTLVKGATITLYNGSTLQANLTDLRVLWWDATAPDGTAPDYYSATESTDAAGLLSIDLDAVTALSVGDYGYLHVHKAGTLGNAYQDALVFAGAVQVQDIG
ncbi:MAG: fibronectin type III domain-containing protein [Anaerolineae bacterium]|nr:fibronectin type III domain-containing protein [Anaerolineae bacterium]